MKFRIWGYSWVLMGSLCMGGCHPQQSEETGVQGISLEQKEDTQLSYASPLDPLEPLNRFIFQINEWIDYLAIEPFLTIYKEATPLVFQHRVDDFFTNVEMPLHAANFLLQGDGKGLLESITRFCINTVFGFFGMVDLVRLAGDAPRTTSFSQTLAKWGATPGPYLVLPVIGPTTLRGALGMGVEFFGDPVPLVLENQKRLAHHQAYANAVTIGVAANERVQVLDDVLAVKKGALDPYASLRSAYWQFMLKRSGEVVLSTEEESPHPDGE